MYLESVRSIKIMKVKKLNFRDNVKIITNQIYIKFIIKTTNNSMIVLIYSVIISYRLKEALSFFTKNVITHSLTVMIGERQSCLTELIT